MKDGLLVAMRNGTYVQHSESVLTGFTMPLNSSYHLKGDLKYDMEPDIFYFNFGNHQGHFLLVKRAIRYACRETDIKLISVV